MRQKVIVCTVLCLIVAAGFFLRIHGLSNWLDQRDRFFFDGQQIPLMLTVDSYYYLELARQLQEGTYRDLDERRHVPNGYTQPSTPPLLSVVLAVLAKLTGVSLEWVALLLPAFLGVLLAFPVYLLSSTLFLQSRLVFVGKITLQSSARIAALAAACAALFSPMLVGRSSVGWCDTDALNVFFPVLLSYLALRLGSSESRKRQLMEGVAFFITSLLFVWWWDQSHIPVFAFIFVPFGVALFFVLRRSPKKLQLVASLGLCLVVGIGLWKGFSLFDPAQYLHSLQGMTHYIASDVGGSPFRAAGEAVSEQAASSLRLIVQESSGGWPCFLLACCGLLLLTGLVKGAFLYLLPLVVVSVLSLKGQRFLIFTAPLFGLGIGTLCFLICYWVKNRIWMVTGIAVVLVGICWGTLGEIGTSAKRVPRRSPILFEAMQLLDEKTEKDAVIWASWGHGHPLLYYSRRATVADGMFHSAELQYVLYFPLASGDFRLAANWISFYVAWGGKGLRKANELFAGDRQNWAVGMGGLQNLLAVGVRRSRSILQEKYLLSSDKTEEVLQWLFPTYSKPVYLFIDYLLLEQAWFALGQWNLESRSGPEKYVFVPIQRVETLSEGKIAGISRMGRVLVDPTEGTFQVSKQAMPLGILKIHDGKKLNTKKYGSSSSLHGNFFLPGKIGVLAEQRTANTILVKLYYEYTYNRRFFTPIKVGSPYYGIWKITGERYQAALSGQL